MVRQPDHRDEKGYGDQPTCRSKRHEPGTAPLLAAGYDICPVCREFAEKALIELPTLFDMCAHALDLRSNGLRERVSGHRPRGIELRDAVVSARSDILGVLATWSGLVTVQRGVAGPNELAVRKLVGFLAIHINWLCEHPTAADFVDDLIGLTESAHEAMRPDTGFRTAVGPCLHPDCDLTVYAEAHRDGAEPYEVSCEAGHVWAPRHWLALRGRQHEDNENNKGQVDGRRSPFVEGAD